MDYAGNVERVEVAEEWRETALMAVFSLAAESALRREMADSTQASQDDFGGDPLSGPLSSLGDRVNNVARAVRRGIYDRVYQNDGAANLTYDDVAEEPQDDDGGKERAVETALAGFDTVRHELLSVAAWAILLANVCEVAAWHVEHAGTAEEDRPQPPAVEWINTAVRNEMRRAVEKHGAGAYVTGHECLGVLVEEMLEVSDSAMEQGAGVLGIDDLGVELIQLAQAATFGVACIDSGALKR